jgi:hypothetical protein
MLGERANGLGNVRAAAGHAHLRHARSEDVVLEEVPPGRRASIVKRYLAVTPGACAHVPVDRHAPLADFEAIADTIPVFRITRGAT